ncbi:MAG: GAP family protein [Candidatus Doudnabacteria bacterium]|jgi:Sap, sulfolipid-1-addressing protein
MGWIDAELALTALAAMLSPTTLTFSVLVLVLGDRPLRTGLWFYLGALTATLGIGIVAAFVLGDAAADQTPGSPKTPVAIFDVVAGALLIAFVIRMLRRPPNPKRAASMFDQMQKVASSPAVAIVGAGAALANPGAFIPIALKSISELDPSTTEYIVNWVFFTVVSLLPLAVALVLLLVARDWAERLLEGVRRWLDKNARTIAAVIIVALAASLIRNGIAGLTS